MKYRKIIFVFLSDVCLSVCLSINMSFYCLSICNCSPLFSLSSPPPPPPWINENEIKGGGSYISKPCGVKLFILALSNLNFNLKWSPETGENTYYPYFQILSKIRQGGRGQGMWVPNSKKFLLFLVLFLFYFI